MTNGPPLPIDDALPELQRALAAGTAAVLVAPPGAGKTTRVPLALLDAPWLAGRRIVLLEPRRLAARAAAQRMAQTLGERVGDTVGLRARMSTSVGPKTRIEVVTEGVFTRQILDDPELTGIGAVILDEFHERSLDADLALALALDARSGLREDLRILVMSATLDGARVANLLGDAPVVTSEGRAYPVNTRHLGSDATTRIEDRIAKAARQALADETGSILVFLPGQGEIARTAERLSDRLPADVDIVPLYGGLDIRDQARAIEPPPPGTRKVVLATSVAETSITIDGVRVVIDSGLERVPRYEPDVGLTRLMTQRVSRASADQRRGRAGRTEPGVCYRLWDEPQTAGLSPFREPEIRAADLSGLLLDCAAWGVADVGQLSWLDPPPEGARDAARRSLNELGALDNDGRITALGQKLRALPLPPRLARMVMLADTSGQTSEAARIAAIIVERGISGPSLDLDTRLAGLQRDRSRRADDIRRMADRWAAAARTLAADDAAPNHELRSTAALLALAYPDRIGKARGDAGHFVLANGRGAFVDPAEPISRAPFIVAAELAGAASRARILLAAAISEPDLLDIAADRISLNDETTFDPASGALRRRVVQRLGAITLKSEPRAVEPGPQAARALAEAAATRGIARLPWSASQRQLRERISFLRIHGETDWPDVSDEALTASVGDWLASHLHGLTSLSAISADVLGAALDTLVPWNLRTRIDAEAPTHFTAPTGHRHPIDYGCDGAPVLAIRVQELYGLSAHPTIGRSRIPLTLHLLSPAHRPIQITRDLPGFWAGSWSDVRAQMRGRYPKHPWPEDPRSAPPTTRAKPRGT